MSHQVVVTDHSFPSLSIEEALVANRDIELEFADASNESEIIDRASGADAILTSHIAVTRAVFEALDDLRVVGRYGIGVDTVDLEAATDHGVQVVNVPTYCEEEVSTHALGLLLSVLRRIPAYDTEIKEGKWDWMRGIPLQRLQGKTVGLVGFGKIARNFRKKMNGFDVDFIVFDPYLGSEEINQRDAKKVSFDELVEQADVVSVHAPLTEETEGLIDETVLTQLKDSAIVINTSRGSVVEVDSLHKAIEAGEIYGAGLDVMPNEPPDAETVSHHHRVVYTPHSGWYSESAMTDLRETVMKDVLGILSGERPQNPVNEPRGEKQILD